MNKKFIYLTIIIVLTSPVIIRSIVMLRILPRSLTIWEDVISLILIPLVLGLTVSKWNLPMRAMQILYGAVLAISAAVYIVPILFTGSFDTRMLLSFLLDTVILFILPVGIFIGVSWLISKSKIGLTKQHSS